MPDHAVMRRTISAAFTSALSVRYGMEPWPGVPPIVRRRQARPFSAVETSSERSSPAQKPPISVTTQSQRSASQWRSRIHSAPYVPPASSSATPK